MTQISMPDVSFDRSGISAQVIDVLQDPARQRADRLLVRWGSTDSIVELASQLQRLPAGSKERPKPGDLVLVDPEHRVALEKLPAQGAGELKLETDPSDRYEDIAGLDDKIGLIKEAIETPYLYRSRLKQYRLERPRGILLYGPPGCGKTMIGRAVANSLKTEIGKQLDRVIGGISEAQSRPADERQAHLVVLADLTPADLVLESVEIEQGNEMEQRELVLARLAGPEIIGQLNGKRHAISGQFLNIKGPELLSKWVGEAEQRIRQIFAYAKSEASYTRPVVIFFDEIESMFQRRGSGVSTDLEKTLVPALLAEMDGVEKLRNVIVIGATNRAELLDPALMRPGRFDIKIKIDRPGRNAAADIFARYLKNLPLAPWNALNLASTFDARIQQAAQEVAGVSYLSFQPASDGARLIPLSSILQSRWLAEVGPTLRAARATALAPTDDAARHCQITGSDLAQALKQVCLAHRADWADHAGVPAEVSDGEIVSQLEAVDAILRAEPLPPLPPALDSAAAAAQTPDPQHLADALIDLAVETLFSSTSSLKVRIMAPCARDFTFLLREFVSGAIIADIVTRAKRLALKRETQDSGSGVQGIAPEDLLLAISQEYEENKEQLVANKPEIGENICETCRRRHNSPDEYDVQVSLGRRAADRWHGERRRAYERGRGNIDLRPAGS